MIESEKKIERFYIYWLLCCCDRYKMMQFKATGQASGLYYSPRCLTINQKMMRDGISKAAGKTFIKRPHHIVYVELFFF